MTQTLIRCLAGALLALTLTLPTLTLPAFAQDFPARRINIVVPFSPGTAFDLIARTAGQRITERYGQPVVVDNKPGASGTLGTEMLAAAAPDGYTLVTAGAPLTVHKALIKNLRYDPVTSFTPIASLTASSVALVINPAVLPVNSLAELIAAIKAKPGHYNYSSPGTGTLQQLGFELFKQHLGLEIQHVPYRGASQAITDFVSGQVHLTYLPVSSALPHVQSGKLRFLANVGSKRSPFAPDVPTLGELGYPTLDFDLWFGFLGPANMPPAIVQWWEKEIAAVAESPDAQEAFRRHGNTTMYLDSKATGARLKSEVARWTAVAEKAGLQPQ
jgi:tripartite-type tricarboxylate transporter receptor subunit TctC